MSDIAQIVTNTANAYGVPSDIALAVANQESGLNPSAISKAGAQGVMQLMPGTAKDLGVTNSFDPVQNIDAGIRYLKQLYNQFGDWALALAAYNAGPGTVVKYGGIPPYQETQNYVSSILSSVGGGQDANTMIDLNGPVATADVVSGTSLGVLGISAVAGFLLWRLFR